MSLFDKGKKPEEKKEEDDNPGDKKKRKDDGEEAKKPATGLETKIEEPKEKLGASMLGSAPPAKSRLKNKTMDEIITRWATDLSKYQKEFQAHAEQVSKWDRLVVENASKIQKLYGNAVDAERATAEVERQLAAVENQQDELGLWLDRYEQEVEALLEKQVGSADALQGPDQERERTWVILLYFLSSKITLRGSCLADLYTYRYKLAERVSDRLNGMNQDLTSIIEEINTTSTNLNKTSNVDEPVCYNCPLISYLCTIKFFNIFDHQVSQIVRILNTHLTQLQAIDQDTASLRAKINASQKLGDSLSGNINLGASTFGASSRSNGFRASVNGNASGAGLPGIGGNSVVDDFYKAYTGRR